MISAVGDIDFRHSAEQVYGYAVLTNGIKHLHKKKTVQALERLDSRNSSSFIKIANPAVGFKLVDLIFGKSSSVSNLAISFNVTDRTHAGNDG
jgi:hypothetical protein